MKSTTKPTSFFFAATALGALLLLPTVGIAAENEPMSLESIAEAAAKTPEQHQALAAYYRGKADAARKEAQRHVGMAASFATSKAANTEPAMRLHCERLADAAKQSATEYDAMAAFHDAEAKKAAK